MRLLSEKKLLNAQEFDSLMAVIKAYGLAVRDTDRASDIYDFKKKLDEEYDLELAIFHELLEHTNLLEVVE